MMAYISTIVSALITGLTAIYVCTVQNDKNMALVVYRLEQLEKKVSEHNNVSERLSVLEAKVDSMNTKE